MTLQTKRVALRPQQLRTFAAVRLVTDRATLTERGLVVDCLLALFRLLGVAAQANVDRVGFRPTRALARVRAMTIRAITGGAGMLHFGGLDQLCLVAVAGDAEGLDIGLGEDNLAVLGRRVAQFAFPVGERRMYEFRHQLRRRRLMWIVTAQAICRAEGLIVMRLLQGGLFRVMTVGAQRRSRFGQVELVFGCKIRTSFVRRVTAIAAQIQRGVAASFVRNIRALGVAGEAEIVFLLAGGRPQQLVLVGRSVGIVAGQAIANRRRVHVSFDLCCIFVSVAGEAELVRSGRDQHYPGGVFIHPDLVAAQTAGGDGGVDGRTFSFVFVTFQALGVIGLGIERNGVNSTESKWQTGTSAGDGQRDAED